MIISRQRGYIFVHIPKTGGTSLARALEARAAADDILIGDTPKAQRRKKRLAGLNARGRLWKHATLADIDGVVDADEMASMFIFTLVRNPWDRLVSYYHWLKVQSFDHPAVHLAQHLSFEDFLADQGVQDSLRAAQATHYVTDAHGVQHRAVFIRLECFAEDAGPLWDHLGFTLDLPHDNRSPRAADYRGYYSDTGRSIVSDVCSEDIARFGYGFD